MAKIRGFVRDASGQPIEGVLLRFVLRADSTHLDETDTDSTGSYTTRTLRAGDYDWTAQKEGFATRNGEALGVPGGTGVHSIPDISLDPVATTTTTSTTTSTTSTTTGTTTTATTTTGTTTTGTTTTGTTTTGTTTTGTTSSTTTSGTTTTATTTVTLAPDPAFQDLINLISSPDFSITVPVNIEEAKECRNLYTIGNYILAKVPESIANLNSLLNSSRRSREGVSIINEQTLLQNYSAKIDVIREFRLIKVDNPFNEGEVTVEQEALAHVRRQFNLGTTSVPEANREFPGLFKQFVALCADDLMGVTPDQLENKVVFDATQKEKLFNFLRKLKATLIRLTESMSVAGTLKTRSVVKKWSNIIKDALDILKNIGQQHVGSDDQDAKQVWSVLATLLDEQSSDIKPNLVHAREGGFLLSDTIAVYDTIRQKDGLENEDEAFLRDIFYTRSNVFPNKTVVEKLKENAHLLRENWPANWP